MEDIVIQLGLKSYTLEIVETEEDRYDGLSAYDYIDEDEGMLFIFPHDGEHPMVMRGMEFPIDIIHLSQNGIITSINTGQVGDTVAYAGDPNSRYVIELLAGQVEEADLRVGMRIKLPASLAEYLANQYGVGMARKGGAPTITNGSPKVYDVKVTDIPAKESQLQVLDHEGKVISNIDMGARIFSRPHTKLLVETAKKGDDPENLKELGRLLVEMIYKQDTQEPEYST